jgi:hypothetical protein
MISKNLNWLLLLSWINEWVSFSTQITHQGQRGETKLQWSSIFLAALLHIFPKSGLWYRFWNCRHQSLDPARLPTPSRTSGSPLLQVQEVLDNFSFILQNTSSNFLKVAQHYQYLQHWRNGQVYMNMCQSLVVLHSTDTNNKEYQSSQIVSLRCT